MKAAAMALPVMLLMAWPARAHEHWLRVEPPQPAAGATAALTVCSGHSFPNSELLLAERLLTGLELTAPGGETVPYTATAGESAWAAEAVFPTAGVWLAAFALKKPQEAEPLHRGRALVVAGGQDDPAAYSTNRGLEIVPGAAISRLKTGDELPLTILVNGAPQPGKITVLAPGGKSSFLSTAPGRPAQLKITGSGWHLLTVSHKGKTFGLNFAVPEPTAGASR